MRVIIAGGRDFDRMATLLDAITESGFAITEVVSGACRVKREDPYSFASGADGLGEKWALVNGVRVQRFYAESYGPWPACGPRRNAAMAIYADALIALPGGRGTANMLKEAHEWGLDVHEVH